MSRTATDARALRESPFIGDNIKSRSRSAREPETFGQFAAWFITGWREEMPDEIHSRGLWVGLPSRLDAKGQPIEAMPPELVGGSELGAPKLAEAFRQLLENSPRQIDEDGFYVRPMRAALARLAGTHLCNASERRLPGHVCTDSAFMARMLVGMAFLDGDWQRACQLLEIHANTRWAFTDAALRRLYRCYRPDAPGQRVAQREVVAERQASRSSGPGWVSMSDSQRAAIEAGEREGAA